ncbi:uncharacterized protein LOC125946814 [Dermacentor silvarum]|uniref:uncharacterized protein LOC125946814 n=1 Tax=Dermacentor silvarum TaxID=543639 RepID=UPI00210139A0|nr:uncharacterized protein LOC125946814 [Dermacentor silvarum]
MPLHSLCITLFFCTVLPTIICSGNVDYDDEYYYYEETSTQENESGDHQTNNGKNPQKDEVDLDIAKFLNTTEKIWVYNSTEATDISCKVDVVHNVTNNTCYFTRYYLSNHTPKHDDFSADLLKNPYSPGHSGTPDEMKIRDGDPNTPFETLIYQSADNLCAVFYLNFPSNMRVSSWFELRLKNSSLENGPNKECMQDYADYLSTKKLNTHFNYTSECQCIFQ